MPPIAYEVLAKGVRPELTVTRDVIDGASRLIATWKNAPGNRNDYLAVYDAAAPDDPEAISAWVYIDALPSGSKDISELFAGKGTFRVRLMKDDGYETLAQTTVSIESP